MEVIPFRSGLKFLLFEMQNDFLSAFLSKFQEKTDTTYKMGGINANSIDVLKNRVSFRIMFELLMKIYNFQQKFKFDDHSIICTVLPSFYLIDFRSRLLENITIFKESIKSKIEKYVETILVKNNEEYIDYLEKFCGMNDIQESTLETFKLRLQQRKDILLKTAKEFTNGFLNALAFRYIFGICVLPVNFLEQLDTMINEQPFESEFVNYRLFHGYFQMNKIPLYTANPESINNALIKLTDENKRNKFIQSVGNWIIKANIVEKKLKENDLNASSFKTWSELTTESVKHLKNEELIDTLTNIENEEEQEYLHDFVTYATKPDTVDITTRVNKKNFTFDKERHEWIIKPKKQVTPEMLIFTFSRYKTLVQQNTELKKQIEELKKEKLQLVETELKKKQTII